MGLFNIFKKNKKEKNTFNLEKMLETKNKNYIFSNYFLFLEEKCKYGKNINLLNQYEFNVLVS